MLNRGLEEDLASLLDFDEWVHIGPNVLIYGKITLEELDLAEHGRTKIDREDMLIRVI